MFILGCLRMLYLVPASWLDAFLVRKKPFEERYAHMKKWSKRIIKAFHCRVCIDAQGAIPQEGPLLFVSNHQSAFDMLLQMSIITTPFTFISKKENEKLPYVANWSKTLELIYFDREDRASAIHMLRESARQLKSGRNLLIFPEGTRARDGKLLELQAGSLQPAFMAKATIIPMVLVNSYDFKHVLLHGATFQVKFLKARSYEEYRKEKAEGLCTILQEEMQEALQEATC